MALPLSPANTGLTSKRVVFTLGASICLAGTLIDCPIGRFFSVLSNQSAHLRQLRSHCQLINHFAKDAAWLLNIFLRRESITR